MEAAQQSSHFIHPPKPFKPRCRFGQGHTWIMLSEEPEICQCATCGAMSSNYKP